MHSSAQQKQQQQQQLDRLAVRGTQCTCAADVSALYDGFYSVGLQYGPGYRTLVHAWGCVGGGAATARLQTRWLRHGTQVHPADLDDALCTSALASSRGGNETRLPFAVDDALLSGVSGALWAVRHPQHVP